MTKTFVLAQQLIMRIFDFSGTAFAEMMVRGERERLRARFRDVVLLTGAVGGFVCVGVALNNGSFVQLWMHGRFSWSAHNDLLMALFTALGAVTRCHIGLAGLTKQIGAMKYVYLAEGAAFITLASVLAPRCGLAGVIISGIVTNFLCSGIYGAWRTKNYFGVSAGEVTLGWLKSPLYLGALLVAMAVGLWFATQNLSALARLGVAGFGFGAVGIYCLWRVGLPTHLRAELVARLPRRRG